MVVEVQVTHVTAVLGLREKLLRSNIKGLYLGVWVSALLVVRGPRNGC
jgi:hypothetical protein